MSMRPIWLAGIAALSPSAIAATPASLAPSQVFVPPDGPVLVSRSVVRSLPDGKSITVTRSYLVWFARDGAGWRIDGEPREVRVEVPAMLEPLAEIERQRTEPGMFPLRLDRAGMIVPREQGAGDGSRARAAAMGNMMIAGSVQSVERRNQANVLLSQVVAAANAGTAWPNDLFNPLRSENRELRDIALPDGTRGSIEILLRAGPRVANGLPERFERQVTTILGGSQRLSHETWTFQPVTP